MNAFAKSGKQNLINLWIKFPLLKTYSTALNLSLWNKIIQITLHQFMSSDPCILFRFILRIFVSLRKFRPLFSPVSKTEPNSTQNFSLSKNFSKSNFPSQHLFSSVKVHVFLKISFKVTLNKLKSTLSKMCLDLRFELGSCPCKSFKPLSAWMTRILNNNCQQRASFNWNKTYLKSR